MKLLQLPPPLLWSRKPAERPRSALPEQPGGRTGLGTRLQEWWGRGTAEMVGQSDRVGLGVLVRAGGRTGLGT